MTSLMLAEMRQTPDLVEAALHEDHTMYAELGRALRDRDPVFVATVARGSSDHAAAYAASLFGILAGRATASVPPSLVTRYGARPDLSRAFVLGLSQSGASPDLVRTMAAGRAAGAITAAVVNAARSPLAAEADWLLPPRAGPERSVAATKSFILTLVAVARLTAAWTGDGHLADSLRRLPGRLAAALDCDWSDGLAMLSETFPEDVGAGAYVVGRGPGLAIAREAALKFKETCNLHAEAVSTAEIQHGPRALVHRYFPVLAFALADPGGADTSALALELADSGALVLLASPGRAGPGVHLPLPAPLHPLLDPIPAVLAFYPFAEALARARGLDPDQPRGLHKVTATV